MVWAVVRGAAWYMSCREKAPGKTRDAMQELYLSDGLGMPWCPPSVATGGGKGEGMSAQSITPATQSQTMRNNYDGKQQWAGRTVPTVWRWRKLFNVHFPLFLGAIHFLPFTGMLQKWCLFSSSTMKAIHPASVDIKICLVLELQEPLMWTLIWSTCNWFLRLVSLMNFSIAEGTLGLPFPGGSPRESQFHLRNVISLYLVELFSSSFGLLRATHRSCAARRAVSEALRRQEIGTIYFSLTSPVN